LVSTPTHSVSGTDILKVLESRGTKKVAYALSAAAAVFKVVSSSSSGYYSIIEHSIFDISGTTLSR
jgi:hypothetical protein